MRSKKIFFYLLCIVPMTSAYAGLLKKLQDERNKVVSGIKEETNKVFSGIKEETNKFLDAIQDKAKEELKLFSETLNKEIEKFCKTSPSVNASVSMGTKKEEPLISDFNIQMQPQQREGSHQESVSEEERGRVTLVRQATPFHSVIEDTEEEGLIPATQVRSFLKDADQKDQISEAQGTPETPEKSGVKDQESQTPDQHKSAVKDEKDLALSPQWAALATPVKVASATSEKGAVKDQESQTPDQHKSAVKDEKDQSILSQPAAQQDGDEGNEGTAVFCPQLKKSGTNKPFVHKAIPSFGGDQGDAQKDGDEGNQGIAVFCPQLKKSGTNRPFVLNVIPLFGGDQGDAQQSKEEGEASQSQKSAAQQSDQKAQLEIRHIRRSIDNNNHQG